MILLGEIHGQKSCIVKEREALLKLKTFFGSPSTWTNDTDSNCCQWEGVECNRGRAIKLSIGDPYTQRNVLLNLSLLHPFDDLQSLSLPYSGLIGLFDDVEGYKSLSRLRNLEFLDLSHNKFNNSIFPFLNAATSLTTLFLEGNYMNGSSSIKELFALRKLEGLDLSDNNHFSDSMELQVFCEMKKLQELNLGGNYFTGRIPPCLGSLKELRVIDLSSNRITGDLPSSFNGLESLEYLSLSDNNFTGLFSLEPLANLTKLKVLKLSSTSNMIQVEVESTWQPKFQLSVASLPFCCLEKIPNFLIYQKNLRLVDLSSNRLSRNIPTWLLQNNPELEVLQLENNSFTIFHMPTLVHKLQVLDFSSNDIGGALPENIGHTLPNLFKMNGSNNVLQGNFPSSTGEMKNIRILDLSYNNFSGKLPRNFVMGCSSLHFLELSHNKFSGNFIKGRANLTSLEMVRINNNLITGIGAGLCSSVGLSALDMSNNRLTGAIPSWISNFSLLVSLSLSNNFLEGAIPPSLLLIEYLSFLDLSGNLLSGGLPSYFRGRDGWGSFLEEDGKSLFLDNNNLTGPIPSTLLGNVTMLDLRNNKLSGSIPQFVNAQDPENFLKGQANLTSLEMLRINNLITGIGAGLCSSVQLSAFDMSNNRLSGAIPSWVSNFSLLVSLSLSNNFLEGDIPPSLMLAEYISFMDLSGNLLSGSLFGDSGKSLFLDNNNLTGPIPGTLLENVTMLDLRNNKLSGSIPQFVNAQDIKILLLRGNGLTGSISKQLCDLRNIRLLDLSDNMLKGSIPSCLNNSSFRFGGGGGLYSSYSWSMTVGFFLGFYRSTFVEERFDLTYGTSPEFYIKFATKRRYDSYNVRSEFSDGTLDFMYGLDLSSNELSGVITTELGDLSKLKVMNLSHNFLSGSIPDSFSKLVDIESIDLSSNKLHGSIPQKLANLPFVSSFNVSYNNLSGIIPQGKQFNTFDEDSYLGNPLLLDHQ